MSQDRRILVLLFASVWPLYLDRGALSVAAPDISRELFFDPAGMGFLLSAFFWTYSICLMISGYLVDRFEAKWIFAGGFLLGTAGMVAGGAANGFAALLVARLLLGLGQSVAFPCYSRILSARVPEHQRGLANALIDVGTKAAPALANLLGVVLPLLGWRGFFLALAFVNIFWLVPWIAWMPAKLDGAQHPAGPGIRTILAKRQAWATFFGLFCFNYAFFFLITWLPSYLRMERRFSQEKMAVFSALPFLVTAIVSAFCGWLSDRLIAGGSGVNRVRKSFAVCGLVLFGCALPGATLPAEGSAMMFAAAAFTGMGIFTSNVWAITQTLAGPEAAGQWTGLQNGIGNMGGVAAPIVTGYAVKFTGSFAPAFLVASAMLLLAAGFYAFGTRRIEPVRWAG